MEVNQRWFRVILSKSKTTPKAINCELILILIGIEIELIWNFFVIQHPCHIAPTLYGG